MTEIALFPLSSQLFPAGRMPLQIFEQRYVDMVARCMREDEGFGVVWLRRGSEVSGGSVDTPNVGDYVTYARIVDWDQLQNGLLGITIEGQHTFGVDTVWREPDGLVKAEVTHHAPRPHCELPDRYTGLAEVLLGLLEHPQVKQLQMSVDIGDAWRVVEQLAQLLPFTESIKYRLLGLETLEQRLEEMDRLLKEISGEDR